jgi:hypothetical protein
MQNEKLFDIQACLKDIEQSITKIFLKNSTTAQWKTLISQEKLLIRVTGLFMDLDSVDAADIIWLITKHLT